MPHTHALFLGNEFLGEVTPNGLNFYSSERLVPLPSTYYSPNYRWIWSGRTPVEDAAAVQSLLLPQVDAQRELLQMTVLTPGGAKKYVYNRKAGEAIAASGILATVLNALSLTDKKKKYPFAYAESALTGEPIAAVLARFETGMNASAAENARIEAVAQKAKRDIAAATTAAGKRAAYAAISWFWQPAA
jgi:hypothetical protein